MTRLDTREFAEPAPTLNRREIAAGDARVATFTRTYSAPIEEVWDACTNPQRLARWYVPVSGELRVGGSFQQAGMGGGVIARCEPPRALTLSLGGGADQIELRLSSRDDGSTALELQHATTIGQHEIGGQMYDAIFCMGGGYYPRFVALDMHLRMAVVDGLEVVNVAQQQRAGAALTDCLLHRRHPVTAVCEPGELVRMCQPLELGYLVLQPTRR